MSKVIIGGGGAGGIDSDELTASTIDVLAGKKFGGVGSDEVQIGTMPYIGSARKAIDGGLNPQGLYYHIPKGYYQEGINDPWVYLTQPEVAPIIGATGNKIIPGQSICGVAGTVPAMGAQTINPSASQQSIATSGKYMTGNVVVNPIPSNYFDINTGQMSFKDGVVASDGVFNGNKFIFAKWTPGAIPAYTYLQDADITIRPGILLSGIRGGSSVTHKKSFNLTPFKTLRVYAVNWSDGQAQFNIHILGTDRRYWIKSLTPWWMELERETDATFTMDISDINQQAYILFYWTHKYNDGPPGNWDMRYIHEIELLP